MSDAMERISVYPLEGTWDYGRMEFAEGDEPGLVEYVRADRIEELKAAIHSPSGCHPMTLIDKAGALAVLKKAQVASCTCQIKTPDPEWHIHNCRYRILREVEAMIDHLPDAAEIAKLQARIEGLESKYQDAFQMYVDSNEAMLDAKAELQEMKMQTLASLGQAQEAYEAQTKLEEKLKLALDKLKAVDKWVEELGMYAPPETSRVPVFKDLPKLIEELSE